MPGAAARVTPKNHYLYVAFGFINTLCHEIPQMTFAVFLKSKPNLQLHFVMKYILLREY